MKSERHRRKLIDAYYRLRRQSSVAKDGGDKMEGQPWEYNGKMAWRAGNGWEVRIYEIEDLIEVCLINPSGVYKRYKNG